DRFRHSHISHHRFGRHLEIAFTIIVMTATTSFRAAAPSITSRGGCSATGFHAGAALLGFILPGGGDIGGLDRLLVAHRYDFLVVLLVGRLLVCRAMQRTFGRFCCRRFRRLDHLVRRAHHRAYLCHLVGHCLAGALRCQSALFRFLGSLLARLFFGGKTLLAFFIAACCGSLGCIALRLLTLRLLAGL